MQSRPAFLHACTSQTVSPTKTAASGATSPRSNAICRMSGAGLLSSVSQEEVAVATTSSAPSASRSARISRSLAELASTTRRPGGRMLAAGPRRRRKLLTAASRGVEGCVCGSHLAVDRTVAIIRQQVIEDLSEPIPMAR